MLSAADKQRFSLLIVDDEPINVQLLGQILKAEGYSFEFATRGQEALDWVEYKTFDVILLDIMMPGMDGYEVCRKVKENPQSTDTVIIFLSAKNDKESIVKGFDIGAVDYISKPFNKKELLARLETHLELKAYRDRLEEIVKEKAAELKTRNEELEKINRITQHFVPFEFLKILGKESVMDVNLGDRIYSDMTIMFSDLRDYTRISEPMRPQEVFDFTNSFHNRMAPFIRQHTGFVQQFQGDGVVAIFPHQVDDAIHAAIAIQNKIREYNAERRRKNRQLLHVGIGLHAGSLMVGIIGDEERWESGIPSDTVNTTARLEGLTKFYGCTIIISETARKRLINPDQFQFRFLDIVKMKGKEESIKIYEILDGDTPESCALKLQTLDNFNKGLDYYFAKDFESARNQFFKALAVDPDDPTITLFLKRTLEFIQTGVPENWDGVTKYVRK